MSAPGKAARPAGPGRPEVVLAPAEHVPLGPEREEAAVRALARLLAADRSEPAEPDPPQARA